MQYPNRTMPDAAPDSSGGSSGISYVWARDQENRAEHLIRQELIRLSKELRQRADHMEGVNEDGAKRLRKTAHALQQRPALTKAVPELKAHPRLTLRPDQFDANPFELNTPAGIVDLRTGEMRPPDPAALCSKATATAPVEGTPARWIGVLLDAVEEDRDVLDWLQRLYGYGLTGLNVEKAVFVVHGPQDTSKSLVDRVTSTLAGGYHASIPHGELFKVRGDRHPTGLKKFITARLATSSEIKPRTRWNSERVKAISGGDRIDARGIHQDFQEFVPTCTMILYGNHLPSTDGADPALVRRIVPIPFRHQIPEADQIQGLADKLIEDEGPQILAWMIEGARRYFERGLFPLPDTLQAAKDEYSAGEDLVSAFIDERCNVTPDGEATTANLREAWRQWCNRHGHNEQAKLSTVAFGRMFKPVAESLGIEHSRHVGERPNRSSGYRGVELLPEGFDGLTAGEPWKAEHDRQYGGNK